MHDNSRMIPAVLALCAMSAVAGCAAPQYDKPIGTFATATSDAQAALASYSKGIIATQEDVTRNSAVAAPYRVGSVAGDCGPSSTRCRLVLFQQQGDPSPLYQPQDDPNTPAVTSPSTQLSRVVTLMAAVSKYTESLNAIVTSDTGAAVDRSVAATDDTVSKIAALMPGTSVGSFGNYERSPLSSIGWMKFYALKHAIAQADPVLARSEETFGAVMQQATSTIQAHMADVVATRRAAFRARATRENLDRATAAAEAYDAFLMNDATPDVVFKELVKAHANLNKALQSSDGSPTAVAEQMSAFQTHANRLAKILRDLQRAHRADARVDARGPNTTSALRP